jgi:hypothetical protein
LIAWAGAPEIASVKPQQTDTLTHRSQMIVHHRSMLTSFLRRAGGCGAIPLRVGVSAPVAPGADPVRDERCEVTGIIFIARQTLVTEDSEGDWNQDGGDQQSKDPKKLMVHPSEKF